MRCLTAVLIVVVVSGCASTNVIDTTYDDLGVHGMNARTAHSPSPVVKTDGRFWKHLLIGSAVGGGTGAIIGALIWKPWKPCSKSDSECIFGIYNLNPESRGGAAAFGALIGAVGGGLIGAIVGEVTRREFVVRPVPNSPAHNLKIIVSVAPP